MTAAFKRKNPESTKHGVLKEKRETQRERETDRGNQTDKQRQTDTHTQTETEIRYGKITSAK